MDNTTSKRILILGGGFAGLTVAMELERKLARDPSVEITLINRENFFLFTPMLHEVAASDLDLTTIVNPVRKMLRRVNFLAGEVDHIDLEQKRVIVSHGFDHHPHTLEFDFLAFGLGSVANTSGLPGVQEHALTMKSLADAMRVRNHLIAHLEEADSDYCKEKETLLTFVVAGGGFAGVETVAGINDFVRRALRSYPHLSEDMVRVMLIHSGTVILPELEESLGVYAQKKLAGHKVEIHLKKRIESFSGGTVRLTDGTMILTNTLVWTISDQLVHTFRAGFEFFNAHVLPPPRAPRWSKRGNSARALGGAGGRKYVIGGKSTRKLARQACHEAHKIASVVQLLVVDRPTARRVRGSFNEEDWATLFHT
jgi:NADH dehydrogenase